MKRSRIYFHRLKTWPEYFSDVLTGRKKFEVRQADRDFSVGDILDLYEWDPEMRRPTGRRFAVRVDYLLNDKSGFIKDGTVVMGITRLMSHTEREFYRQVQTKAAQERPPLTAQE